MVWVQCWMLLLLLELQAADGLLTLLSVCWCIRLLGEACLKCGTQQIYPGQLFHFKSVRRTRCEGRDRRDRMEEDHIVSWR